MNCLGLMLHTFLHHHGFFIAIKIFNFMLKGAHGDSQNTSDFFASKKKKCLGINVTKELKELYPYNCKH